MNQLKIVNGRYQYPMRGRQLPSVQSSDLFYDTRIPINRGKSPNIIFTREAKYFDLSLKE